MNYFSICDISTKRESDTLSREFRISYKHFLGDEIPLMNTAWCYFNREITTARRQRQRNRHLEINIHII